MSLLIGLTPLHVWFMCSPNSLLSCVAFMVLLQCIFHRTPAVHLSSYSCRASIVSIVLLQRICCAHLIIVSTHSYYCQIFYAEDASLSFVMQAVQYMGSATFVVLMITLGTALVVHCTEHTAVEYALQ
jgi:hypothetical protein